MKQTRKQLANQRARSAVIASIVIYLITQLGLWYWIENYGQKISNPEYGVRYDHLIKQQNDSRPLILCIGTSKGVFGFHPESICSELQWNGEVPRCNNFSQNNSYYLPQYLSFRRLLDEGIVPKLVIFELKADHLMHTGVDNNRIARFERPMHFYYARDWSNIVALGPGHSQWDYLQFWWDKINPVYHLRHQLITWTIPNLNLEPDTLARKTHMSTVDEHGWYAFPMVKATPERRKEERERWYPQMRFIENAQVNFGASVVLNALIDDCQSRGIELAFVHMPEASDLREMLPKSSIHVIMSWTNELSKKKNVLHIDARDWMADDDFVDFHHLHEDGAKKFSRRLGRTISNEFKSRKNNK